MAKQNNNLELNETIENNFTYHQVKKGQPSQYKEIRSTLKDAAYTITELCPPSRETSLALTKLEEAMFWANSSIARN